MTSQEILRKNMIFSENKCVYVYYVRMTFKYIQNGER